LLSRKENHMKKFLSSVLLAVVGLAIYNRIMGQKAEQELWTEATSE